MKINQTTDYKIFKKTSGNRNVNRRMVEKLISSLNKNNLLYANPVIVNKKMEVIDGQHRIKAAEAMGLPVYYIVAGESDVETVRLLNANAKTWLPADFVKSYADLGNREYKTLLNLMEEYVVSVSTVLPLFYPGLRHSEQLDIVRGGTFMADNIDLARNILNHAVEWGKYAEKNVYKDGSFVLAVLKVAGLGERFEPERMVSKLKEIHQGQPVILRGSTVQDYLRQFEDIYNHSLHSENRVRLF